LDCKNTILGFIDTNTIKYEVSVYSMCKEHKTKLIPVEYWKAKGIDIHITNKTLYKLGREKYNDGGYFILGSTFNIWIMRKIEELIANYLTTEKPKHLFISAYQDEVCDKRLALYLRRLQHYGYVEVYKGSFDDGQPFVIVENHNE
jgi:hypothetical protein